VDRPIASHGAPVAVQDDEVAVAALGPSTDPGPAPCPVPLSAGSTKYRRVRVSTLPWMSLVIVTRFPSESWTWLRYLAASKPKPGRAR
jgi:hypothetical protein